MPDNPQDSLPFGGEPPKKNQGPETVYINADGGSRGNPGPAGSGAIIKDANGQVLAELSKYLGHTTNNVAEYQGLLIGLARARELGATKVIVRLDSELLVKQINGVYKVKSPHLKPLFDQAKKLLAAFPSRKVEHVRREFNKEADRLANLAMDRGK